jgi:alkanesulfonate monooxygenase SsuD/methylene tetrahydromethanopterin reductase-like flavin-dependent oxidoreductase (luciferase family)
VRDVAVVQRKYLEVMSNEHHETFSNLNAAMPLTMTIAARATKRARILSLGNPVNNRPDRIRVATEMAMIDVVSHRRLDCGFVHSSPNEMSATNGNPIDMKSRFYEAIDLIAKAWTSHDGSFSWEGEFFHHRQVDILPRPYQEPHPPIWIATLNAGSAWEIADRDYTLATMFNGKAGCSQIFNAYRARFRSSASPRRIPRSSRTAATCLWRKRTRKRFARRQSSRRS